MNKRMKLIDLYRIWKQGGKEALKDKLAEMEAITTTRERTQDAPVELETPLGSPKKPSP